MRRRQSTSIACGCGIAGLGALVVGMSIMPAQVGAQAPVAAPSTEAAPPAPASSPTDVEPPAENAPLAPSDESANAAAPKKVDIQPRAGDEQIAAQLHRILDATPWFADPEVEVDEGVVFLSGRALTATNKEWAGQFAAKTQDVVAVVNLLDITDKSVWDFSPAWEETRRMGRITVQSLPRIAMAAFVLGMTSVTAGLVMPDVPRVAPPQLAAPADGPPIAEQRRADTPKKLASKPVPDGAQATLAEGELRSEKSDLRAQAANSRELETGPDLLKAR